MAVPASILPSTLDAVSPAAVTQYEAIVTGIAGEFVPTVDLTRGAVYDIVLQPAAVLAAATRTAVDNVWNALSPSASSPPDVVDAVASLYRVTRKSSATASGSVTVIVSSKNPLVVPVGTTLTIGGQTYKVSASVAVRSPGSVVVFNTDQVLAPIGNNWYFVLPVTASAAGAAGNFKSGAAAIFSGSIPNFVRAYGTTDATGGADAESNASVIARLGVGLASRGWSTRAGIVSTLTATSNALGVTYASVVGFGDPEMSRDRRTPWSISIGNRADVYIRPTTGWTSTTSAFAAVLTSKAGALGTWQITLNSTQAAGMIDAPSVIGLGNGSTAITPTTVFGLDSTAVANNFVDVQSATEAAYSAYRTAVITFTDPSYDVSSVTVGTTAQYALTIRSVGNVANATAFMAGRDQRPPASDIVVKGAAPIFTSVGITLKLPPPVPGTSLPTTTSISAAVAAAISSAINTIGFSLSVSAAAVSSAATGVAPAGTTITGLNIFGQVLRADGTWISSNDSTLMAIAASNQYCLTANTASPWCNASDVSISFS